MSNVGIGLGSLDWAEEEFMEAVRYQSIGVEPSKNPVSPTERRLDGVKPSLGPVMRPVLTKKNSVDRGGAPRDPGFYNQKSTSRSAATGGKAEKEMKMKMKMTMMMMMMMVGQTPASTVKAYYARPSYSAAARTGRQMNIGKTTPLMRPSVMPLRLQSNIHQHQQHLQQPKAVATAQSAHRLVPVPLTSPLQGIADKWARDIDAARERQKQLKLQFRRDFGIGY